MMFVVTWLFVVSLFYLSCNTFLWMLAVGFIIRYFTLCFMDETFFSFFFFSCFRLYDIVLSRFVCDGLMVLNDLVW